VRYARAIYLEATDLVRVAAPTVELTAGTIEFHDTGGDGPVPVLLGGVCMDGSVWEPMVADLQRDHRCVVPTLPLGAQAMRLRPLRRLPVTFGWMAKRPLPEELVDRWLRPLQTQRAIRRDLRRYAIGVRRRQLLKVCRRLRAFDRPTLVVWTPGDRVQRPEHGRRLAELLPDGRLVEVLDSDTLIMRDQPQAFARAVRELVRASPAVAG
jgi:hypothetical protein